MRKFYGFPLLLAAFGLVSAAAPAQAQIFDFGPGGDPYDLSENVFDEDSGWDLGGWVQFGYHNESTGLFNKHPHRFNNHQSWLYLEKAVDGSDGLDIGGRVDFMYGVDAADTQAFGNHPGRWDFDGGDNGDPSFWANHGIYGYAIPQAYVEAAYGDLSVKVGHFYTLLGYEVVTAPDNFFYSHSFTMYNSEAFTHTGALATYSAADNVELYGGWTAGWDTGFDQFNGGSNFLGGASIGLTDDITFIYITTAGNLGKIGDGYSHSIVVDFALTDKWNYVFQSDLLNASVGDYETVGINQFLFYTVNEKLALGGRAEWWKADGASIYVLTAGINYRPTPNLIIRPEIRYQWDPGTQNNAFLPASSNQDGIFGVDAILTF